MIDAVTSDAFIDLMIEKGVKFGAYFNYMPVGARRLPRANSHAGAEKAYV